jgi:peptidoglycan/LPS O-acetylase OafA/YrhL
MSERIGYLDGWRGLAILCVLEAHFVGFFESFNFDFGRVGIDVFFSLSGMLMAGILFEQRMPLGLFYRRRISRILPVFVVFVCAVFGYFWLRGAPATPAEFASTLTFLRTYLPVTPGIWDSPLPIGHIWSLNVEEHCYLALGLLAAWAVLRGREAIALIAAGVAVIALRLFYTRHLALAPASFDLHTEVVAAPLLLSGGYRLLRERYAPLVRSWMPVASFLAGLACYLPFMPGRTEILLAPFLMAFTVNHLGQAPAMVRQALESRAMNLMGIWSYSIYLWQQPFFSAIRHGNSATAALLAFAGAMTVALLSFYLLESPLRRWLNGNWLPKAANATRAALR